MHTSANPYILFKMYKNISQDIGDLNCNINETENEKEKKYEDAKENFLVVKLFYGIFIIYGKCRHDCKS